MFTKKNGLQRNTGGHRQREPNQKEVLIKAAVNFHAKEATKERRFAHTATKESKALTGLLDTSVGDQNDGLSPTQAMSALQAYLNSPRTRQILNRKPGEKGFSLIELVIVVAVLSVLAAIAIPAFQNLAEDGRKAAAKSSLAQIYKECEVSKMQTGAASHTALAAAVSGVNYSNEAVVTTCGGVANAVTTGGAAFSINLVDGVKTGTW